MRRHCAVLLLLALALVMCGCGNDAGTSSTPTGPDVSDLQQPGPTYWWNDEVFYEVFVRSFYDSDGDGIGDLQGLIQKLDYLNDGDPETDTDLGVTGLWLMPIMESPSYHGYDATDYRTVDPDYGTNADFQQLITEAHARGIKVIVDLVMNHCSSQHPWFTASAADDPTYAEWFSWRADNPGWQQPWGGGQVWHQRGARGYYYGVFWGGMPDLNYALAAVETEMFDTATFWLQDMGADGFRLDAVKYLMEDGQIIDDAASTFDFWTRFRQHLDTVAPAAYTVGEAWDSTDVVMQYLDAGLHTCFEFDLATAMIQTAGAGLAGPAATKMTQVAREFPYLQQATFLTNHDQKRVLSQLSGNIGQNRVAAALLLTLPGVPFLFYGEEVGMVSSWTHEDVRRPMHWTGGATAGFTTGTPWQAPASNVATNNVDVMQADDGSLWHHYRNLVQVRTNSDALRRGTYLQLDGTSSSLFAFLRVSDDEAVVAVHNLESSTLAGWTLSAEASQLTPGVYLARDILTGTTLAPLTVGEDGVFADWRPAGYVAGQGVLLIALEPERR